MVAHGCRKRKKLICGPEGEIVVAHGRLPSPAPIAGHSLKVNSAYKKILYFEKEITLFK